MPTKKNDLKKTKAKLIEELNRLRERIAELEVEEALQTREHMCRALADNSQDYIIRYDRKHRFLYANPAALRVFGKLSREYTGKTHREMGFPQHLCSLWENTIERVFETGEPQKEIFEWDGAEGRLVLDWLVMPDFVADGSVVTVLGVSRDITERGRTGELLRLNNARIETLLKLNQMIDAPIEQLVDFALEEGIKLTKSKIGFLAFLNEDQTVAVMHGWSKTAMEQCAVTDKPKEFVIAQSGLWGDAVRLGHAVIINDYSAAHPSQRGYPRGHVEISRYLGVPAFEGDRIVIVAGVANKDEEYDELDARQLTLLMDGVWRLVQRKRSEEQIKAALAEKEVLLKEVHHRVKNNMTIISSLLSLQAQRIQNPVLEKAFKESQNRILSMALVHEMLYNSPNMAKINFYHYIRELLNQLSASYKLHKNAVSLNVQVERIPIDIDTAMHCGLIINELVTNAYKYAFPRPGKGEIYIGFSKKENQHYEIVVSDNGIGLPGDFDIKNVSSLGLKLASILTKQLKGEIELDCAKGTTFKISFPAKF